MSFTVVPLQNLTLPAGSVIPFGAKFVIKDVPEWLRNDAECLDGLSREERRNTLAATQALVSEYHADSWGYPDQEWHDQKPKGIQDLRFQSAILANMAIWIIQPTPLRFTVGFHALTHIEGRELGYALVGATPREQPLWCHPRDHANPIEVQHLVRAAALFEKLSTVPRKNVIWAALRAIWCALVSYAPDNRYPLFWQALESLFTSETKTWKVTERLCARISYFLADNFKDQEDLYAKVDTCYATRSKIIHGRWDEGPEIDEHMADTEAIVRTVIRTIADRPGFLEAFLSPKRDEWLEEWVQSKRFASPPLP